MINTEPTIWLVTHRSFRPHARTSILGVFGSKWLAEEAIKKEEIGRTWTYPHWSVTELTIDETRPFRFDRQDD